jgi:Flagellar assembly protein T, N-terminal domain
LSTTDARRLAGAAAALLLAIGPALAADKLPEVVTREATGEAAIVGGNVDRATREAKEAALREAVEQVAGVMISAQTLSANSQLISDQVFSHSAGYVRSYQVLSQSQEKGVVKVTVRAEVGTKELDRDLQAVQALVRRLAGRKLVILVQEQTIDDKGVTVTSGVAATVLTDAFKRDGWTLVDPSFAAGKVHLASAVALGAVEAKEIGTLSKADYILYGTVAFRDAPADAMLLSGGGQRAAYPLTGDFDFGVFETSAGSQLAKVSGKLRSSVQDMSVQSREESAYNLLRAHSEEIVSPVRKAVLESLRSAEQNGNRLVLEVVGVGDFASLQAFTRELPKWSAGVRELATPTLSGGRARMDVTYLGTAAALAEQLEGKTFKGKKLAVTGVAGSTLEVTIGK